MAHFTMNIRIIPDRCGPARTPVPGVGSNIPEACFKPYGKVYGLSNQ